MEPLVIKVIAERLIDCQQTLDKLIRKAARFGATGIAYSVSAPIEETRTYETWDGRKKTYVQVVHMVEVTGAAPTVGDYDFVAKLEHTEGGVIIDVVPGAGDIDTRFREGPQECEHCKARRYRKNTFVVRERSTGRQVQVGHNCIHDFLGVRLAHVLQKFTFFSTLNGDADERDWYGRSWQPDFRAVDELLTLGHVLVGLFGYASLATAEATGCQSTSYYVSQMFRSFAGLTDWEAKELRKFKEKVREARTDEDAIRAAETRAWAIAQRDDSDYMHNLRVLCAGETVPVKRQGYVVSAISANAKALDRQLRLTEQRKKDAESKHVGTIGDRLRGLAMVFESARVVGSNGFGDCCLWKMRDETGNLFSWFTGRGSNMRPGERFTLDATVKDHREFKGVAETQLTRCKVLAAKVAVSA